MRTESGRDVATSGGTGAATAAPREVTGAIVRGLASALEKHGLKERVLAEASPDARALLARPPLHFSWAPAVLYEELVSRAAHLAGPGGARQLGHDLVWDGVGPILRPLLKTVTGLMGGGPAGLLKGLPRAVPMQYRGLAFDYREEGPRGGVLTIDYGSSVDPIMFNVWEGCLEFGEDIHGVPGKITLLEVSADHRRAHYRITW